MYPMIQVSCEQEHTPLLKENPQEIHCIYNTNSFQQVMIREAKDLPILRNEALIKTYPSKTLKKHIFKELESKLEDWQLKAEILVDGQVKNLLDYYYDEQDYDCDDLETRCAGFIQIVIPIKDPQLTRSVDFSNHEAVKSFKKDLSNKINKTMRFFGYDFSSCDFFDSQSDVYFQGKQIPWVVLAVIGFEAKYQTDAVAPNRFLYHLTTRERFEKIKRRGLQPRAESSHFEYSSRIYLFNCDDLELMCQYAMESEKKTEEWVLLKIDPSKIQNLKLYVDKAFLDRGNDVVFTFNNIQPGAIVDSKSMSDLLMTYKEMHAL